MRVWFEFRRKLLVEGSGPGLRTHMAQNFLLLIILISDASATSPRQHAQRRPGSICSAICTWGYVAGFFPVCLCDQSMRKFSSALPSYLEAPSCAALVQVT